jgi:hypothetical protein
MKYFRNKIGSIQDGEVWTHIYTVYIVFNNIFLEAFEHKFYLSMDCVALCVTIHGYNQQNNNLGKKKHTFPTKYFLLNTGSSNFYTYLAIHSKF